VSEALKLIRRVPILVCVWVFGVFLQRTEKQLNLQNVVVEFFFLQSHSIFIVAGFFSAIS
jgi:hypothetical protein